MSLDRVAAGLGICRAAALGVGIVNGAFGRAEPPSVVEIQVHFSRFGPESITVPAGRPVTFVLANTDPIDHEWIVGDAATHLRHRTGTEPAHDARPTEISLPAMAERRTTVTFDRPGVLTFVCHLPGHEAYGMAGTLIVTGG
ncbi:MAG TPA: cupredoxin domain-containing protein [Candidatus Limnocylindrales bacterium]|nr:cupredoxin domain-containing protein [Candidatus Limnocylindrales bacterium]